MQLTDHLADFPNCFPTLVHALPWTITTNMSHHILTQLKTLDAGYRIYQDVAIHVSATVEEHVTLKGPIIISAGSFVGAHAYLRGGVFLSEKVSIGPGCEVKSSMILKHSSLAHFNFVGDSLVGSHVNMEAGSIVANHFNERKDKTITAYYRGNIIRTDVTKFGALIGDHCKIGANAVLSPGTVLLPNTVVKRLELVDQHPSGS